MSKSKGDAFQGPSPFEPIAPPKRSTRSALKASSSEVPQTGEKAAATTSAAPTAKQTTPPSEKYLKKPRVQLEGLSFGQIEDLLPSDEDSDFSYDENDEYEKLAKDYDDLLVEMDGVERKAQQYILENADLHQQLKEIKEQLETANRDIARLQTRVEELLDGRRNSPSADSRATQPPSTSALPSAVASKQTIAEPTSSAVEAAEKWSEVVRRKPAKKKETPAPALPKQQPQRQNKQV
uniref:Uncharacterized protein n=1 Tax=Anopheles maculatus TaxID=74869 RepID=A0A182SJP0_9DIPT